MVFGCFSKSGCRGAPKTLVSLLRWAKLDDSGVPHFKNFPLISKNFWAIAHKDYKGKKHQMIFSHNGRPIQETYLFLTFKAVSHTRSPEADAFLPVTQRFKQIKDLSARVRCLCWGETANIMGFWLDWIARHLDVPVFLLFCSCCFPPYILF